MRNSTFFFLNDSLLEYDLLHNKIKENTVVFAYIVRNLL